jgi:hypothetical protein
MMSVLMYVRACPICELSYTVGPHAYHDRDLPLPLPLLLLLESLESLESLGKARVWLPPERLFLRRIGSG